MLTFSITTQTDDVKKMKQNIFKIKLIRIFHAMSLPFVERTKPPRCIFFQKHLPSMLRTLFQPIQQYKMMH